MAYDPHKHHRRSIRLKGYDYSRNGLYFVTICLKNGLCLLGDVVDGEMKLNQAGEMVEKAWLDLPNRFPQVELDAFRVMPNHFHSILGILNVDHVSAEGATTRVAPTIVSDEVGAGLVPALIPKTNADDQVGAGLVPAPIRKTLGDIIGAFKSITTNEYIVGVHELVWEPFPGKLWQRNFYEHIIRNERTLNAIRDYIINNPVNWLADQLHPNASPNKFNATWKKK
jgi:REP element-mobilizing transposase RayT